MTVVGFPCNQFGGQEPGGEVAVVVAQSREVIEAVMQDVGEFDIGSVRTRGVLVASGVPWRRSNYRPRERRHWVGAAEIREETYPDLDAACLIGLIDTPLD